MAHNQEPMPEICGAGAMVVQQHISSTELLFQIKFRQSEVFTDDNLSYSIDPSLLM
jgi:hypothetical protein